jgi:DNA-binding Xre family transcriptional regulator
VKVKLAVRDIAEARGYKNAKQLADASGIHYKSMYTIWSGDAQLISMDVLGRLCTTLRVQAGMLFEVIPDADSDATGTQDEAHKKTAASKRARTAKNN